MVGLPEGMEVVRRVLEETKDYVRGMELCDRLCSAFGDVGTEGVVENRWWLSRRWRGSDGTSCSSCRNQPKWMNLYQWIVAITLFLGNRRDQTTCNDKGKHISLVVAIVQSDHGRKLGLLRRQNVARREMEVLEAAFRHFLIQTGQVVNNVHLPNICLQPRIGQHCRQVAAGETVTAGRLAYRAMILWRVTTVHRASRRDSSKRRSAMMRRPFGFR